MKTQRRCYTKGDENKIIKIFPQMKLVLIILFLPIIIENNAYSLNIKMK